MDLFLNKRKRMGEPIFHDKCEGDTAGDNKFIKLI